jgi:phosphohistidine phosphatase
MSGQSSNDDILVFIMRHGEAESPHIDDKSRNLTETGRQQTRTAARWLKQQFCSSQAVDLALVSPYTRAQQTFAEVKSQVKVVEESTCADIVPESHVTLAHDYLDSVIEVFKEKAQPLKQILLVSHMPFVSYFLDELCHTQHARLFATGSIAVVRYNVKLMKGNLVTHFQGMPDRYQG